MSEPSMGAGWWRAPDGRWYPNHPALHGIPRANPPEPADEPTDEPGMTRSARLPATLIVIVVVLAVLLGAGLTMVV